MDVLMGRGSKARLQEIFTLVDEDKDELLSRKNFLQMGVGQEADEATTETEHKSSKEEKTATTTATTPTTSTTTTTATTTSAASSGAAAKPFVDQLWRKGKLFYSLLLF